MGFLWRDIAYDVGCPTFHGLSDGAKSVMHIIHTLEARENALGGEGGGSHLSVLVVKFCNDGFSSRKSRREAEREFYDRICSVFRVVLCFRGVGGCIQPVSLLWGVRVGCGGDCGVWLIGEFRGFFCFFGACYGLFRGDAGGVCVFGVFGSGTLSGGLG